MSNQRLYSRFMADIVEKALQWYKHFKYNWLPGQLHNTTDLIDALTDKVDELERILTRKMKTYLSALHSMDIRLETVGIDDGKQFVVITNPSSQEYLSPASPHISNHTHENQKQFDSVSYARPKIQLKRIVLAEAEGYLPSTWKPSSY